MRVRLFMAAALVAAYLAAAPLVVNGDGLGYLKAAMTGAAYPGHVAYVPLLAGLARVVGATTPLALLWPARVLSALAAAVAALAVAALAGRRNGEAAARAAFVGMAASWGTLAAGSDVESYAPALAALALALWCADPEAPRVRPVGAGLATAAAALFHVENVLFGLTVLALLPRRAWGRFFAAAALPVATAYAALAATRGVSALGGASHGLTYPVRPWTAAIAVYGACKALVYAPYPYEASWTRVLGCFAAGATAAAALATAMRRPLPKWALAAWIAPYALVGVTFYASDAERWIFLLPLAWLAAATGRPRRALVVAAALLVADAALWLPVAHNGRVRARAEAAAHTMHGGDLVIGPGHGWDEYVGFYGAPVETFPLVYWAGAVGRERLPAALAEKVTATWAAGRQVFLARMVDDGDPMGWKELTQFAITPATARALLPRGRVVLVGDGIERLDPP